MVCVYCSYETEVVNSRKRARLPSVWRRRVCKSCVAQFSTIEHPDYSTALNIKNDSGKLQAFSRDKLFLSLYKSLGHRSDALNSATALTETIIGRLLTKKKTTDGVINPGVLTDMSHEVLKRFDKAAASSYKAYHRAKARD